MKTFLIVAAVACLAVIFVEIDQINAGGFGGGRKCRHNRPPINETEVTCDRWQLPIGAVLACKIRCLECYLGKEDLLEGVGCLIKRRCMCLVKGRDEGNGTTTTTTTVIPETSTTVPSTTSESTEETSTASPTSENPIETSTSAPTPTSENPGESSTASPTSEDPGETSTATPTTEEPAPEP